MNDMEDVRMKLTIMQHLSQHPNIIIFKDVFEDHKAVYLVMELARVANSLIKSLKKNEAAIFMNIIMKVI